jgi:chitinase
MEPSTLYLVIAVVISSVSAEFISALSRCPAPCQPSGVELPAWTYYHDLQVFTTCDGTILFETNLYNAVDDSLSHVSFRACTAQGALIEPPNFIQVLPRNDGIEGDSKLQNRIVVEALSWGPTSSDADVASVASVFTDLKSYMENTQGSLSAVFASRRNIVVGLYAGPGIDFGSIAGVMDAFSHAVGPFQTRRAIQSCGAVNGSADRQSFGLVLDTHGDISATQSALGGWAAGKCLQGDQGDRGNNSWWPANSPVISTTPSSLDSSIHTRGLVSGRDTCRYIQAQSGDGCWSLTQRCGITQAQLESYNGGASFCNNINIDQYVCCSSGTLPDFSPQPTNGNCYSYTVKAQDTCASIATAHQMKFSVIENNNNQTWGWMGCSDLQIGQKICLSTGKPPFPVNVPNAVCGPQANGTTPTSDPSTWSGLNPCLLNACCDIWGQCGITSEFCIASPADTGAPGTAQPGSNGCISNCGTDIKTSAAPDSFARIGYFEAWNGQRPCLHMWVSRLTGHAGAVVESC